MGLTDTSPIRIHQSSVCHARPSVWLCVSPCPLHNQCLGTSICANVEQGPVKTGINLTGLHSQNKQSAKNSFGCNLFTDHRGSSLRRVNEGRKRGHASLNSQADSNQHSLSSPAQIYEVTNQPVEIYTAVCGVWWFGFEGKMKFKWDLNRLVMGRQQKYGQCAMCKQLSRSLVAPSSG